MPFVLGNGGSRIMLAEIEGALHMLNQHALLRVKRAQCDDIHDFSYLQILHHQSLLLYMRIKAMKNYTMSRVSRFARR
jgi:hypothetical protein